jgi:hypothetical protein
VREGKSKEVKGFINVIEGVFIIKNMMAFA